MSYSDINQFSQQCIRQVFTACFLLTGSFLIFNHVVFAHGVVHQRIDELTAQIQQSPDNTQLLFERGLLYADD
ncbi:MAG TPA: hypothetical protein ENJ32_09560, partial [Crenotrichaceae bacterium]|nr:hypothetical protein [Crenotrichaceae bacterium]